MRRTVVMILTPVYYGTGILGLLLVIAFSVIFQAIKDFVQGYVRLISMNPLWVLPDLLLILLFFLVYALKGFRYPNSVEQKAAAKKIEAPKDEAPAKEAKAEEPASDTAETVAAEPANA